MLSLQGLVERVTFASEESGYSVLKVRVPGQRDLVTAVGNFAAVSPGETLLMEGEWGMHPRFGQQFRVERYELRAPSTVLGIKKYLGSGLVRGIGPKMAERIVKCFGETTLDVIENEPERLREVEGIGKYRIAQIKKAWDEQREIRSLMVFLRSNGASAALAVRIFKQYGPESLNVVRQNPYRLAMEVLGVGFLTADNLARNLGFQQDSPMRAEAGIVYVLHEAAEEGHVCLPFDLLIEKCKKTLQIEISTILEEALLRLKAETIIREETLGQAAADSFGGDRAIYLRSFHIAETNAAKRLMAIQRYRGLSARVDLESAVKWVRGQLRFTLAPLQEEAVKRALSEKVMVITGGPGTGKTTLIRAILAVYSHMGARVNLAAPTGRAAKRLSEATGHPAATIHRLLEFSPQAGGFQRNEQKPLSADLIIVDESSMMDTVIAHHLFKAVPQHAVLILVGDSDQLPSVGPGNVLGDIIDSGSFPVTRLTEIFRQASQSRIITNAHMIRQGIFPDLRIESQKQDFYFIGKEDPEEAVETIVKLCTQRIPRRFGFDPIEDVQVLSPMHRGVVGAQNLNFALQNALNPSGITLERGGRVFRVRDKVMQIRNNYDKEVFNGDIGRVAYIDQEAQQICVDFEGRSVPYDFSELDELVLAYAVSIHKAQGSEYPAVIFPLLTQHYMMLQRNLLYTAVTRAKKLAVIVGSKKALAIAVRNNQMQSRFTLLAERLSGTL